MSIVQQRSDTTLLSAAAGDEVNVAATAIGAVQTNPGADQLILHMTYTKGTEAGVKIYAVFPTNSSSDLYTEGKYTDTGSGILLFDGGQTFLFDATTTTDIPIDLRGRTYFRIYQISNGAVGATAGKVVLSYTIYG